MPEKSTCVTLGPALARYGFGEGHPFGPDRMRVYQERLRATGVDELVRIIEPRMASRDDLLLFHTQDYVSQVERQSETGTGYLDYGDTPAFAGVFEAAATVVGSTLHSVDLIMQGDCRRAFVPIAGLHHARRDTAAGFCVFNDCGVAIEHLKARHGIPRVAYVDIDAHHGDGVFYAFVEDPDVIIADIHEDGDYLYPGTGAASEDGRGKADGTKLNVPLPPGAGDGDFLRAWEKCEAFLEGFAFDFVLLQCGADGLAGDPITHLEYSAAAHTHAARRLVELAEARCEGRLLALGGGGYNRNNLAEAWTAVTRVLATA